MPAGHYAKLTKAALIRRLQALESGRTVPTEMATLAREAPESATVVHNRPDVGFQFQCQLQDTHMRMALEAAEMVTWEWDVPSGSIRYSDNVPALARGESVAPYSSVDGLMEAVHPDDRPGLAQALDRTRTEGLPFECEYRVRMLDGVYRWIRGRGKKVVVEGGKPVQVLGVSQDITESKRAEAALRESERRLRAFLENTAVIAWMKDEQGRHVLLSDNYQKRLGVRFADWKGKTDFELWPREVAEVFRRHDLAVLEGGRAIEVIEQAVNPDGSRTWWLNSKFVFRDATGRRFVGGLGVDITERVRAEEALRESEARYRLLFDRSSDAIFLVDAATGRYLGANRAAEKLTGRSVEELKRLTTLDVCPKAARARLTKLQGSHGTTDLDEVEYVHKNGTVRTALLSAVPLAGNVFYGIAHDITERKRSEQSLRESEARTRLAQEAGHVGVFDIDATSRKSVWSEQQEAIYGLAPGSFEGTHEAWKKRVHPEDLLKVESDLGRDIQERKTESQMDFRILRPAGQIRWVTIRCRMTYDESGRLLRVLGTTIDVTEQKRAEAALMESEQRFVAFMSNTPAAAYIKDEAGRYVYCNQVMAGLAGMEPGRMLGRTDAEWLDPRFAAPIRANEQEVLATQKPLHRLELMPMACQATAYWLACKFPLLDAAGRRFVGGVSMDVTTPRQLQEEIVAATEREQRRVGHELHDGLGQQLSALEMKCFLLLEDLAVENGGVQRGQLMKQVREIARGLRESVAATRSLARGLAPVSLKADGLMDALKELAYRTRVPGKVGCSLTCPVPVLLQNAQTAQHLYRIAQEAVSNALRHAKPRRIAIRLKQEGEVLLLQVKDDGRGLPRRRHVRSGMGMEIMRYRAELIGATLKVASKPAEGVTVTCRLNLNST